jgi:aquaporin Z
MAIQRRILAEFIGTFWLVLGGCGTAVLAANAGAVGGVGLLGVAFAFGLTVLTGAYALGHVSGGHFNPAVTIGLWTARRFESKGVLPYIVSQLVGATLAAAVVLLIANGRPGYSLDKDGLATNGYGSHSPGGYNLLACIVAEVVMTLIFLLVIIGVTDRRAPRGMAPLAIGLALTLIHLITIPVTNTSVNPARSTGPAIFVGGSALGQLWLFWVAPIAGAIIAGLGYRYVAGEEGAPTTPEIGAEEDTVARQTPASA